MYDYGPLFLPAHWLSGQAMLKRARIGASQKGILLAYLQTKEGLYPLLFFSFCQRWAKLKLPVFVSQFPSYFSKEQSMD
jgi:hypothetical protein